MRSAVVDGLAGGGRELAVVVAGEETELAGAAERAGLIEADDRVEAAVLWVERRDAVVLEAAAGDSDEGSLV